MYPYNNIITNYSALRNIMPSQNKNISAQYKVMCDCECCIYAKSMQYYLLSRRGFYLKKLKDISQKSQNIKYGETTNHLFRTYKTLTCNMQIISMKKHMAWEWKQCAHINHPNMDYHNGNVSCVVVLIYHILIFHAMNQIGIIPTHLLQYGLMFITQLHVV